MPLKGTPTQRRDQAFREFARGKLHSGKGGPIVTNPKQAQAIALAQTRKGKSKGRNK